MYHGLKLAWDHGYRDVLLEIDSKMVVDMLRNQKDIEGYNGVLVERCQKLSSDWLGC